MVRLSRAEKDATIGAVIGYRSAPCPPNVRRGTAHWALIAAAALGMITVGAAGTAVGMKGWLESNAKFQAEMALRNEADRVAREATTLAAEKDAFAAKSRAWLATVLVKAQELRRHRDADDEVWAVMQLAGDVLDGGIITDAELESRFGRSRDDITRDLLKGMYPSDDLDAICERLRITPGDAP